MGAFIRDAVFQREIHRVELSRGYSDIYVNKLENTLK